MSIKVIHLHISKHAWPRGEDGLTLVELMIAMAISLLLLAGLTGLIINSNRNFQELATVSQQIENGRYALQVLKDDIRHAGYYGQLFITPVRPGSMPDPCSIDLNEHRVGMGFPVQGYDSLMASPVDCVDDDDYMPETDVIVVRRASTNDTQILPNFFHIQSSTRDFLLSDDVTELTLPDNPPIRPYFSRIYHIRPWSVSAGDGVPTLVRRELVVNGAVAATVAAPLVEGIENVQYLYGIDDTAGGGNGRPDRYIPSPADEEWHRVVSIRIFVLARNITPSENYTDTKVYDLGGETVGPVGDAFKRRVYSTTVRLANPAGRRE